MKHLCENCKYTSEPASGEHCRNCTQNSINNFEPRTNADCVRNMTDEELAELIGSMAVNMDACSRCPAAHETCVRKDGMWDCEATIKRWLQSPVEVNDEE